MGIFIGPLGLVQGLRYDDVTLVLELTKDLNRDLRRRRGIQVSTLIDGSKTQREETDDGPQPIHINTSIISNPSVGSIRAIVPSVPATPLMCSPTIPEPINVARER